MPRWIALSLAIVVFAALSLSIPATTFTHKAFASKMDGKPFGAKGPQESVLPKSLQGTRGRRCKEEGRPHLTLFECA